MAEQVSHSRRETTAGRFNTVQRRRGSNAANHPTRGNFAPINHRGRSPEFWRNKFVPGETDVARQLRLASRHFDKYGNPVSHPLVVAPYKNRRPLAQQNDGDNNHNEHRAETSQAATPSSALVSHSKIEPGDGQIATKRANVPVATPLIDSNKPEEHSKKSNSSAPQHTRPDERKQSPQKPDSSPATPAVPKVVALAKVENSVDAQKTGPEAPVEYQAGLSNEHQNHMNDNNSNFRRNGKLRYGNNYRNNRNNYRNYRNNRRSDGRVVQSNSQAQNPAPPPQKAENAMEEPSTGHDSVNRKQSPTMPETAAQPVPATADAAQDKLTQQKSPAGDVVGTNRTHGSGQEAAAAVDEGSLQVDSPANPEPEPETSSDTVKKGGRRQRWQKGKPKKTRNQRWPKIPNLRKLHDDDCISDYWDDGHHLGQLAMVNVDPIEFDDPDYDVKQLMDWEGGWIPAPIEWEDRAGYLERNFKERMQNFIKGLEEVPAIDISSPLYSASNNTETATRSWIPVLIDNTTAKNWWAKHLKTTVAEVEPNAKPWWELYANPGSDFLKTWSHPHTRMNTTDPQYEIAKQDEGSELAYRKVKGELGERLRERVNNRSFSNYENSYKEQQNNATKNNNKMNRNRPKVTYEITRDVQYVPQNAPKCIKQKSNIFLREALQFDMTQITDIYNYHVNNSIHVAEKHELSVEEMRSRMNDIKANNLPFLVAVDRFARSWVDPSSNIHNDNNNRRNRRRSSHHPSMEKIVGFAYADDYHGSESMYRYTCEFEIFVHSDYYRQRVGSCLMDKMTSVMDIGYNTRGGYAFQDGGSGEAGGGLRFEPGGCRRMNTVVCHVPYASEELKKRKKRRASKGKNKITGTGTGDNGDMTGKINNDDGNDDDDGEKGRSTWLFAWLEQFGYEKVGDLPEVGVKMGQFVNLAIFHRKTGFQLDPRFAM